jgi:2-keto-3-deoxy-L-rhamnonate aldolase RhmA
LAELAGKIGFDVVWIEMEHGPTDFSQAENICFAAQAGGALPAVRLPDGQRCHVLRALEIGARIVIVPMINTQEQAAEVVQHGKYPPLGMRGFNNRTRGTGYGLAGVDQAFAQANADTQLFVQIETREAVENLDAIVQVEGLSGILIGPCDLSMSCGMTGKLDHPDLIATVVDSIRKARNAGIRPAILVGPGPMLDAVLEAGCELIICGGDIANLTDAWTGLFDRMQQKACTS